MNQSYPAFVSFHSQCNCFGFATSMASISNQNGNLAAKEILNGPFIGNFRMRSCENPNIFCEIQVFGKMPFTNIHINSVFAEISGFQEKQEVILEKLTSTSFCSYIEVAPRTDNDYSVIAQSQASIETTFLDQVRLVSSNMILPYFVSPGVFVQLRILNIIPPTNDGVILNNETELHVQSVFENSSAKEKSHMAQNVANIVQSLSTTGFSAKYLIDFEAPSIAVRVLPRKIVEAWLKTEAMSIKKSTIYMIGKENSVYNENGIVQIRSINTPEKWKFFYLQRIAQKRKDNSFSNSLLHMFDSLKIKNKFHCIDGSGSLESYKTYEVYSTRESRICNLEAIDVMIDKMTYEWVEEFELSSQIEKSLRFKSSEKPMLIPALGKVLNISIDDKRIQVKLVPNLRKLRIRTYDSTCFLFDSRCHIVIKEIVPKEVEDVKHKEKRTKSQRHEDELREIQNKTSDNYGLNTFSDLVHISSHSKHLSKMTHLCRIKQNHSILLGAQGHGKSTFLKRLARRLAHSSSVHFCKYLQCSVLKGKSADAIERVLNEVFVDLEAKKPSVLLLDDFDVILPQLDQEQRQLPTEKVVSVFCRKLRTTEVSVVIAAQRLSTLNNDFLENVIRARPVISNRFELGPVTKNDRTDLLRAWINDRYCKLSYVVEKADGFTITEIRKLAATINVENAMRGSQRVEQIDVDNALDNFVSGKIGKEKNDEVLPTLDDVGGMFEQKALLEQVIIWPKKYPKLFESVGVPVSKGVLLHGPSGCGKTLLANAMISQSKFSLVSVKGPELLSKYIGSSEENVRQVFEKARACVPSILFFDELDSLAPKRGSDSTGVTDRVVNQLLTELDGAEGGMKGVIVIGCTSRIDLIDEALLRPGRFDHHVKCTYPPEEERVNILKVLAKRTKVEDDIDYHKLANMTDGWSGADLQLLFTNAQFVKSSLSSSEDGLVDEEAIIDFETILSVFEDSQPKPRTSAADPRIGKKVTLA